MTPSTFKLSRPLTGQDCSAWLLLWAQALEAEEAQEQASAFKEPEKDLAVEKTLEKTLPDWSQDAQPRDWRMEDTIPGDIVSCLHFPVSCLMIWLLGHFTPYLGCGSISHPEADSHAKPDTKGGTSFAYPSAGPKLHARPCSQRYP